MSEDELREALAAIEHDQWVEWSQTIVREGLTDNRITRWASYWRPYAELDEATKDHDRKWADRVLAALSSPETTPAGVLPDVDRLCEEVVRAGERFVATGGTGMTDEARQAYEDLLAARARLRAPAGVLDEAWAAAEKALPEGWGLGITKTVNVASGPYVATTDYGLVEHGYAYGRTPAAALQALAAALGRSGSGGGRG